MPEYDSVRFQPPAPVARVTIRNPSTEHEVQGVPMLIDSGADVTLIPQQVAVELTLELLSRRYELVGFDGRGGAADAVVAVLSLEGKIYRGQFLVIDQDWGILGRNILNTMTITLDGPRREWR
jgi:hypothetical protein